MDDTSNKPFNPKPTPIGKNPLTYAAEDLFQGEKEIYIRHGEDLYKVLITRNGKLIMNK